MARHIQRARAAAIGKTAGVPGWAWAVLAAGLAASLPAWGQTVPPGATIPPPADGTVLPAPRSENPQVDPGVRPTPDRGVLTPPEVVRPPGEVIRPPSTGTMPVIPPPGSAGGDRGIVPK